MAIKLILASTSPYRKQLLAKLNLAFECQAPNIDETAHPGETAIQLVQRLAEQKAAAIACHNHNAIIIGSDQVAVLDQKILTKPGNFPNAVKQLTDCSARSVLFYTGLTLQNTASGTVRSIVDSFEVKFRPLSEAAITRYLQQEEPYDCAGSFKAEGLGITLFEYLRGDDPNSLIGLPLIRLVTMLSEEGFSLP